MITVTVCVGSSCHVKGAREMIACFSDFLTSEELEDKVELKGSFCMERCGEGINWQINEETISSPNVQEGAKTLRRKIQKLLKQNGPEQAAEGPGSRRT
ncbi:MAG: (2Fe-2S) ferredoxin domain-containing protein [Planctomycetota bacterium]|jgi:NADH:ubiquinone oxidoreductase subunit E